MLKSKITATNKHNALNRTRRLTQSLVLGATILSWAHAASASPAVNSVNYVFRTALTNSGVDLDAQGAVQGNLIRRGAVDNQQLKIAVSKLDANTTYHLVAFLDDDAGATSAADIITDSRGGASASYIKNSGAHPLPAALDPISNVRELDIVNGNGDAVL